jgi:hypothetical protein
MNHKHVAIGCHIVQICHKNRITCMRLVGNAPECMFMVEGRHIIAYIFLCHFVCVYIYICQHQEVFMAFMLDQHLCS